jgi:hypothetical protein
VLRQPWTDSGVGPYGGDAQLRPRGLVTGTGAGSRCACSVPSVRRPASLLTAVASGCRAARRHKHAQAGPEDEQDHAPCGLHGPSTMLARGPAWSRCGKLTGLNRRHIASAPGSAPPKGLEPATGATGFPPAGPMPLTQLDPGTRPPRWQLPAHECPPPTPARACAAEAHPAAQEERKRRAAPCRPSGPAARAPPAWCPSRWPQQLVRN